MCISIPPKYAVSNVVGYIKGKSAISIARKFMGRKKNFTGENFWARGYFVTTVGLDEDVVRRYIRDQEVHDERLEQLNVFGRTGPLQGTHELIVPLGGLTLISPRLGRG